MRLDTKGALTWRDSMRFSKLAGTLSLSLLSVLAFHPDAESHGRYRYYRYYPSWSYWGGYYAYPAFYYGAPYPYPYAGIYYAPSDRAPVALRLEVRPVEAEVFVDGYLAGIVDEFDGFFQRLDVAPGSHEIVIRLEGHRTIREKLYFSPGASYKIRRVMEPLAEGETTEPRPEPPPEPEPAAESRREASVSVSGFGILELRVQPTRAEILIDGEPWPSGESSEALVIHVPAGEHRVEIRSPGHEPFVTDVSVGPGKTTTLNVKLPQDN
jgi:hypothetical protein